MPPIVSRTAQRSRATTVLLLGLLLTTIFVLLSGVRLWRDREIDIEQWRSYLSDTSLILAEHVRESLTAADLVLRSITDHVENAQIETDSDLRSALATQQIFDMLRNRASSAPQVSVATIVALDGTVINFTRSWPPPPINLADRDYFEAHIADRNLEIFLSAPVRNRGTGTWTFYLARKIRNSSGDTIGLTLAGIESAFFSDFYGRITSSPGSAISLLRSDGPLLARYPARDELMGASFVHHPIFEEVLKGHAIAGTLLTREPRSAEGGFNSPRMIAPRKVTGYPVVVNLAVMQHVILNNWWKTAYITAGATTLASVLLIVMTLWIVRLLRRQEENLAALSQARNAAEDAALAKADFLAHMSHEIRTPLNAVIGLSSLLRQTQLSAEQKNFVGIIARSGDHLLSLLNNVLDLSRLETGRIEVERSLIDIDELVTGALETAESLKGEKQLKIVRHIEAGVPDYIVGDAGRVMQVLLNLLGNAVKYTSVGSVELRVRPANNVHERIFLRFVVSDTGVGISPLDQARLFEPFERGRSPIAKTVGGSGLGLAISRRTVELMGGQIGFVSQPGKGSTFWFQLPFEKAEERQVSVAGSYEIVAAARSLRVLVAEDTPANQALVRAVLEKMGHTVHVVGDGNEAVEAVQAGGFDVVVMDVQMPNCDGYEATRRIRKLQGVGSSLPIIGLTAYAGDADRRAVFDCGMDEFVSKPFRISTLASALQRVTETESVALASAELEGENAGHLQASSLETLRSAVGAETFQDLVRDFEATLQTLLSELEAALAARNEQSVRVLAHRLIGVAGQFGGKSVAKAARELEAATEPHLAQIGKDLIERGRSLSAEVVQWERAQRLSTSQTPSTTTVG